MTSAKSTHLTHVAIFRDIKQADRIEDPASRYIAFCRILKDLKTLPNSNLRTSRLKRVNVLIADAVQRMSMVPLGNLSKGVYKLHRRNGSAPTGKELFAKAQRMLTNQ